MAELAEMASQRASEGRGVRDSHAWSLRGRSRFRVSAALLSRGHGGRSSVVGPQKVGGRDQAIGSDSLSASHLLGSPARRGQLTPGQCERPVLEDPEVFAGRGAAVARPQRRGPQTTKTEARRKSELTLLLQDCTPLGPREGHATHDEGRPVGRPSRSRSAGLQGSFKSYALVGRDSGGGIRTRDLRVMRSP